MKSKLLFLLLGVFCFTGCSSISNDKVSDIYVNSYIYNYIDNAPEIVEGERPTAEDENFKDPFANVGLYQDPELKIDGIIDDEYISKGSGKLKVYEGDDQDTYVYLYKGENAIYFIFEAFDKDISVLNVEDTNICTAQSDSVELYVDTYGAGGTSRHSNSWEFRMTAGGRVYSYLTGFVSKVFVTGTANDSTDVDEKFCVEGYISYDVLGNDVDKKTPTSFSFARVTKTGNRNFTWHGWLGDSGAESDPQIPNTYKILHTDNKMYSLSDCPLNCTISGTVTDTNGKPLSGIKVSGGGKNTYTWEGEYSLELDDVIGDVSVTFSDSGYSTYKKTYTQDTIRMNRKIQSNQVLLASSQTSYNATFKGKLLERDNKTPISGGTVTLGNQSATTDSTGSYTLEATCSGYKNSIKYSAPNHEEYTKDIDFNDIQFGNNTELDIIALDENSGDYLNFGGASVGYGSTRVVRNSDNKSFKMVLKTESDMTMVSSWFEVFIDTKTSSGLNQRDGTDYRFDIAYEDGLVASENYGGNRVDLSNTTISYGRINEQYYVEVDFAYSDLGITSSEVIGLYVGLKHNYNWDGMYENGGYVNAENPQVYYRLGLDSKFYKATSNY